MLNSDQTRNVFVYHATPWQLLRADWFESKQSNTYPGILACLSIDTDIGDYIERCIISTLLYTIHSSSIQYILLMLTNRWTGWPADWHPVHVVGQSHSQATIHSYIQIHGQIVISNEPNLSYRSVRGRQSTWRKPSQALDLIVKPQIVKQTCLVTCATMPPLHTQKISGIKGYPKRWPELDVFYMCSHLSCMRMKRLLLSLELCFVLYGDKKKKKENR